MTSSLDTTPGPVERRRTRRFLTQFFAAFLVYLLILGAALIWGDWDGTSPWRLIWVLAPILPILATAVMLVRYVARSDEYEMQMTSRSLAIAFVVTMLAAVVIGFLGFTGITVPGVGWWIYGIGMLTWLIARVVLQSREAHA
ncbi:hypothetical protein [Microbacterium gorillae]|uniref:hypothetical protein n=1 Tax=Microbacterium gorillae TaxID=1231063 RepID=UPI0011428864|nr:hypothetical protein [Microbacterium gorillae]